MTKESTSKQGGSKWWVWALCGVGFVFLVTWGLAKLIASIFPDDPAKPKATKTKVVRRGKPKQYKLVTIQPPARTKTAPRKREWVGKKPNLPSHKELMAAYRAQRTYASNLPKVPKPGTDHFRIKRKAFKAWLAKPLSQSGALWYPHFKNGRPVGMVVREIKPGTFLERLGLYKGDVLLSVNGREIVSPSHAHKYYKKIASRSRNLTLKFKRGGKEYTVDFDLK